MCGIVGYVGNQQVVPVVIEGLRRLEYRGYDSAGIAVVNRDHEMQVRRASGKLRNLEEVIRQSPIQGEYGLGHTRWATHGRPTEENAHPHRDGSGRIVVVHNGIIENYLELKRDLISRGHVFKSETDTEVVAHLIQKHLEKDKQADLETAFRRSLAEVRGIYALVAMSADEPEKIVAARLGSPLILGLLPDNEYMVASGMTALLPYTREVIYMEEHEMAVITPAGYTLTTTDNQAVQRES